MMNKILKYIKQNKEFTVNITIGIICIIIGGYMKYGFKGIYITFSFLISTGMIGFSLVHLVNIIFYKEPFKIYYLVYPFILLVWTIFTYQLFSFEIVARYYSVGIAFNIVVLIATYLTNKK